MGLHLKGTGLKERVFKHVGKHIYCNAYGINNCIIHKCNNVLLLRKNDNILILLFYYTIVICKTRGQRHC